jgi:hypothetical protein
VTDLGSRLTEPWYLIDAQPERSAMEQQLRRELTPGHLLHGERFRAVGRRQDRDDVLFALDSGWAIVHLCWTSGPSADPRWPKSWVFSGFDELQQRIAADIREFGESE